MSCVAAIVLGALASAADADTLTLHSGGAPVGSADPAVTCRFAIGSCPLSPAPFTPIDFASACLAPPATVIGAHPAWIPALSTDPAANWVGVDPFMTAAAALFCQRFDLPSIPSCSARVDLTFAGDDQLGDTVPDSCGTPSPPNAVGVYLNGQPILPAASWPPTGFTFETSVSIPDARAFLVLGANTLHVYHRDMFGTPSGAIWTMTVTFEPDADGDLVGDACDDCPGLPNPPHAGPFDCNGDGDATDPGEASNEQCDADADGLGDACDCLPTNPLNPPLPEVPRIDVARGAGPEVTISWAAVPPTVALGHDVHRGFVPAGRRMESCLGSLQSFARVSVPVHEVVDDAERRHALFFYVVSTWCRTAEGTLGDDSLGDERWPPPWVAGPRPEPSRDADGDSVQDVTDVCPLAPDPAQADLDGDGLGDACDGCVQAADSLGRDQDGDSIGDACDCDVDGDLVENDGVDPFGVDCAPSPRDSCPRDFDPSRADGDADGVGDACDACPAAADPTQLDADHDGCGDACDPAPADPLDPPAGC